MTCYRKKLFPEIVQPDRVLELGPLLDLVHPVHVVGVLAKLELDRVGEVVETELSGLPRKLPLLLLLLALLFMVTPLTLWFRSARRGRRNLDDDEIAAIRHPRERENGKSEIEVEIGGQIAERFLSDSEGRDAFSALELEEKKTL